MNTETIKKLLKDWRVALLLLLVIGSLVGIYLIPPNPEKGLEGNLQFGLDLEGGSWLQLEFQSVVVGYSTTGSVDDLVANLRTALDTEVIRIDENHLEIRKDVQRGDLEPIFAGSGASIVTYQKGVSAYTADEVKRILNEKVNALGMQDARIHLLTPTGSGFPQYVRIERQAGCLRDQDPDRWKRDTARSLRRPDNKCQRAAEGSIQPGVGCRVHVLRCRSGGIPGGCPQVRRCGQPLGSPSHNAP